MAKNQMDGECFYKYVQDLMTNQTPQIIHGQCFPPPFVGRLRRVRITWTCFRRLQMLLNEFDRNIGDIHDFVNGFSIKCDKLKYVRILRKYHTKKGVVRGYILIPGDDEMAIETMKYVMPLIVSSSKPKYVVKKVIRYIKDFKHLIPYVVEYYKRMYMGFEDL